MLKNKSVNKGPGPVGFWARLLCGLGFHKKSFVFGWTEYLDGSGTDGYTGGFYCARCGISIVKKK